MSSNTSKKRTHQPEGKKEGGFCFPPGKEKRETKMAQEINRKSGKGRAFAKKGRERKRGSVILSRWREGKKKKDVAKLIP